MTDTKHNGWHNYETWRVNLELFDEDSDTWNIDQDTDVVELAETFKANAHEAITNYGEIDEQSLAVSYASSFLEAVNWGEIARSKVENFMEDNAPMSREIQE